MGGRGSGERRGSLRRRGRRPISSVKLPFLPFSGALLLLLLLLLRLFLTGVVNGDSLFLVRRTRNTKSEGKELRVREEVSEAG